MPNIEEEWDQEVSSLQEVSDQFGNVFQIDNKPLSKGGQGVVYRTSDSDIAIKQPIKQPSGELDYNPELKARYSRIRTLPLPKGIHLTMPLSILRDQPGYVMRLLKDMTDLSKFFKSEEKDIPCWLSGVKDKGDALKLLRYAKTGGAMARLETLFLSAALLARLHLKGLVYGDVSPHNIFVGKNSDAGYDRLDAWLIDVDNLRLERVSGGRWTYTDPYGAPEIVQRGDPCRPRTDCWSFAVMAFELLTLAHPFIGKKVMDESDEEDDWAADSIPSETSGMTLRQQANAGLVPYIYDPNDDSNGYAGGGLPLGLVSSEAIQMLFLETFGPGRLYPHRRPNMVFWALELARAYDRSIACPECGMSYFAKENAKCPFCDNPRPAFLVAKAKGVEWEKVLFECEKRIHPLPHRLFHPFSLAHCADVEYEAEIDLVRGIAKPARGARSFPSGLEFRFFAAADNLRGASHEV